MRKACTRQALIPAQAGIHAKKVAWMAACAAMREYEAVLNSEGRALNA